MLTTHHKKRLAALVAAGSVLGIVGLGSQSAQADPQQFAGAFAAVGSDTSQDVMNGFAGFSAGKYYPPVYGGTTFTQLNSFDAVGGGCITTKIGGPSYDRPNGSSAGRRALSRALDGTGFGTAACGGAKNVAGQVDIARSSALPVANDTGTLLAYIPFARDGVTFGVYKPETTSGPAVTTLTRSQINTLFTTGPTVVGSTLLIPCGIQTSSGTFAFWNTATGASAAQEDTATKYCQGLGSTDTPAQPLRLQESDPVGFVAKGNALNFPAPGATSTVNGVTVTVPSGGAQVVVGYSAANFIAQTNGAVAPSPALNQMVLGSVSDNGSGTNLGLPTIPGPTAGTLAPNPTFYNDPTFGRRIFNVVSNARITGAGQAAFKALLLGNAPGSICATTSTINTFGFLPAPDCGTIFTTGSAFTGQNP